MQPKACIHHQCLNHEPDMKRIATRIEPCPSLILGREFSLFHWCCNKPMQRLRVIYIEKCQKCGAEREDRGIEPTHYGFLRCICCGREKPLYDPGTSLSG